MKNVGAVLQVSLLSLLGGALVLAACSSTSDSNAGDGTQTGDNAVVGNPNGKDMGGACVVGNDCKSGACEAKQCTAAPLMHMRKGSGMGWGALASAR